MRNCLGENIRLFNEVEYEFDVIKLDQGVTYETVIQQLKQIEGFIENYDEYLRYKDNAIIKELKRITETVIYGIVLSTRD